MVPVALERDCPTGRHPILSVAKGLDESPPLAALFGSSEALRAFLEEAEVDIREFDGYMWVDDEAEVVVVSLDYLAHGPRLELYLDFVHEVVHMKQLLEGRELFDEKRPYVQRRTELEAYEVAVEEARRLDMAERDLVEYLRVPWISEGEHLELLSTLGVG